MTNLEKIQKILEVAGVNGTVTINDATDETVEVYSIDELVEVSYDIASKSWEVGHWQDIPGSYWEPSDVDYVKVFESKSIIKAMQHAIDDLVGLRMIDIGYVIFPEDESVDQFEY